MPVRWMAWGVYNTQARWWFQISFIFTPSWGRFPFCQIFFNWVETTIQQGIYNTYSEIIMQTSISKIPPTYPWKIPWMFHQLFMKDFLSLWGFGEVWGPIFPGALWAKSLTIPSQKLFLPQPKVARTRSSTQSHAPNFEASLRCFLEPLGVKTAGRTKNRLEMR